MGPRINKKLVVSLVMLLAMPAVASHAATVSASYLYTLSNFAGNYPTSWPGLAVDKRMNEAYVLDPSGIKIFNDNGMEVYGFNESLELGYVTSLAVEDNGDMVALAFLNNAKEFELIRCNYRGDFLSRIYLTNIPAEMAGFMPGTMLMQNGLIYLVNYDEMKVLVSDRSGVYKESIDLARLIEFSEKQRNDTGISGFAVAPDGTMVFTVGVNGKAYSVAPDRTVRSFGRTGSRPGTFGVPGGVAIDSSANYILIADTLRCCVLVFDKVDLKFVTEFGYRSLTPEGLIGPLQLAVDNRNRVYVTQLRDRGVNVYQITSGS